MILYDRKLRDGYVDKMFIAEECDFAAIRGRRQASVRAMRRLFLGVPVHDFKFSNPGFDKYELRDAEMISARFGVTSEELLNYMAEFIVEEDKGTEGFKRPPDSYLSYRGRDLYGNRDVYWVKESTVKALMPQEEQPVQEKVDKGVQERATRHWLLSTTKTLAHFKITGYSGMRFDYNRDWNRRATKETIYKLFAKAFYDVIIPNALIAKDAGFRTSVDDAKEALKFVFRTRMKVVDASFGTTAERDAFIRKNVAAMFGHFVQDFVRDKEGNLTDRHSSEDSWWTLEKYLRSTDAGKFIMRQDRETVKPRLKGKLKMLVDKFLENREIGKWSYEKIASEFGVSLDTVTRFKKMLKERRKKCSDSDFILF